MNSRYQKAKTITIAGAIVNAFLGIIKIAFGFIGHSQALLADGIHSLSDLVTDTLVVFAAKIGSKQPDEDHPYGHARIETAVTIVVAILIMIVGLGIAYDGIHHLLVQQHWQQPDLLVLIVAIIAIATKEAIYRYTHHVANKINSNLLRANAWHHRSDALVSLVVLVGISAAYFGFYYFDAIAAIFVAGLIIKMGWQMIWENMKELVDTGVDLATLKKLNQEIIQIPGVESVHQLRTRSHAGLVFVDAHIMVAPWISVSEGHFISDQVYARLTKHFDKVADVTVHIDPEDDEKMVLTRNLPNRQQIEMLVRDKWKDLPGYNSIEKMLLHYLGQSIHIELVFPEAILQENKLNLSDLTQLYQSAIKNIAVIASVKCFIF